MRHVRAIVVGWRSWAALGVVGCYLALNTYHLVTAGEFARLHLPEGSHISSVIVLITAAFTVLFHTMTWLVIVAILVGWIRLLHVRPLSFSQTLELSGWAHVPLALGALASIVTYHVTVEPLIAANIDSERIIYDEGFRRLPNAVSSITTASHILASTWLVVAVKRALEVSATRACALVAAPLGLLVVLLVSVNWMIALLRSTLR